MIETREDSVVLAKGENNLWSATIKVWNKTYVGLGRSADEADHMLWKQVRMAAPYVQHAGGLLDKSLMFELANRS